jgi:hypothetical protein
MSEPIFREVNSEILLTALGAGVVGEAPLDQTANYTAVSDGAVMTGRAKWFTMQVIGVTAAATSWTVNLRGSLTGVAGSYFDVLTHSNTTDSNGGSASNATQQLANYFYVEVAALTLGSATAIKVNVTGSPN